MSAPRKSQISEKKRNPNIKKSVIFDQFDINKDHLKVEFWDTNEEKNEDVKIGESSLSLERFKNGEEQIVVLNLTEVSTITLHITPIDFPSSSDKKMLMDQESNQSLQSSSSNLIDLSSSYDNLYRSSSPSVNLSSSSSLNDSSSALNQSSSSTSYDISSSLLNQPLSSSSYSQSPSSSSQSLPKPDFNSLQMNMNYSSPSSSLQDVPSNSGLSYSIVDQPKPLIHNYQKPKYELTFYKQEDIKRDFPQLARGSYGTVYTGYVTGIKDKIVIKDMEIRDHNTINEWRKEIDMMNKTRCPYVVDVIGYSSMKNILTIIMEYMPKGSLYNLIHEKKENLSLIQRMRMARHCALGLEYLHSKEIIHRDIKSMNILVANDYSCKLTDFGTAKNMAQNMQFQLNTANSGTPLWMAPEVKHGMAYDYSADIYSLGLVLYELFEQRLPHFNQMTQSVELPSSFQSCKIVFSCINPVPKKRPTASAVVANLNNMITNVLEKVESYLMKEDKSTLDKIKNTENLTLYTYLLQMDPKEADSLISKAFGDPEGKGFPKQPQQQPQQSYSPHMQMMPQQISFQQPQPYQPNFYQQPQMIPQMFPPQMPYQMPYGQIPQFGYPPL